MNLAEHPSRWPRLPKSVLVAFGRRLAGAIAILLAASLLAFSLIHLAPGSVEDALLGYGKTTPEAIAAVRQEYGLDRPLPQQYFSWLAGVAHFDFKVSPRTREPVVRTIAERWKVSAFLGLYAFIITLCVAIPLGILAALHGTSAVDRAISAGSLFALCSPPFAVGVLLLYLFAVALEIFPVAGAGKGFVDRLEHLTLPALALATGAVAYLLRVTRAAVITELNKDYVIFARARGLSESRTIFVHVLRNAAVPIVTMGGFVFASLITRSTLIEIVFSLPGLGQLMLESLSSKDIPTIQALTILLAALIVGINILVDVVYFFLNPRIRLGQEGGT